MSVEGSYTPMMNHYLQIKEKHQDAIIFYRLGDFYEMFFEDAEIASKELDLVLTGRSAGIQDRVPMCGIPYHASNAYIQRLIQKGYKVAIVEQLEEVGESKGLVKRDVIRIVTPGTNMDDNSDEAKSVYLASIYDFKYGLALVYCEVSTGEMRCQIIDKQVMDLCVALLANQVVEVVVKNNFDKNFVSYLNSIDDIIVSFQSDCHKKENYSHLIQHIDDFRINEAFDILINYLDDTQKRNLAHLSAVELINEGDYLQIDYESKLNLELVTNARNQKGQTLFSFMNKCQSAMGSRLLKKWIERPLMDITKIEERYNTIEYLNDNFLLKEDVRESLNNIYDLERLSARISYGSAHPKDIIALAKTLSQTPILINLFAGCSSFQQFQKIDMCANLCKMISHAIVDNPPPTFKDGGIFVDGYNESLDEVRKINNNGKAWILDFEDREKARTGIKFLKIGYNRVFGYYIEITKANVDQVKEEYGYVRKQTLSNAERFISRELKQKEEALLHAQEQSVKIEIELFQKLLKIIREYLPQLHNIAQALSTYDVLYSLAQISSESGYTRAHFHDLQEIEIDEGRHPILDHTMRDTKFISNDFIMKKNTDILLITGPNMGGKSTYMRQNALLIIMAQMGCYIPAKKANLPIIDRIFTRIGASDDIMSGKSTFMVEMLEANNALKNATSNSLILFDEIGRGTSTYDGMALAQAMLEYICNNIHAKTLFSTHYHELTMLDKIHENIMNVHVEVHEESDNVTFLYRVVAGKADKSYGINVARLADLPTALLTRAQSILDGYEDNKSTKKITKKSEPFEQNDQRLEIIIKMLDQLNVNEMTPIEALQCIADLKEKIK